MPSFAPTALLSLPALLLLLLSACSSSDPAPDVRRDLGLRERGAEAALDLTAVEARAPDLRADSKPCTLVKPYSTKNAVCNQCAQSQCCAEINGCLGDPACDDDYVNCTLACALSPPPGDAGVSSCLQQCAKDYPKGKAEYDVAIGCADGKCAKECS